MGAKAGVVTSSTAQDDNILYYENFDMVSIVTPVKVDRLEALLRHYSYDKNETDFLVDGFKNGFSLGYQGRQDVKIKSPNLKFNIGSPIVLWNKVMKEVKEKCYAGPFRTIPFKNYIQSPIGLVPKDGGKDVRLIFHLSYPRKENSTSVNANTPKELCTVTNPQFDDAIKLCIKVHRPIYGAAIRIHILHI